MFPRLRDPQGNVKLIGFTKPIIMNPLRVCLREKPCCIPILCFARADVNFHRKEKHKYQLPGIGADGHSACIAKHTPGVTGYTAIKTDRVTWLRSPLLSHLPGNICTPTSPAGQVLVWGRGFVNLDVKVNCSRSIVFAFRRRLSTWQERATPKDDVSRLSNVTLRSVEHDPE